MVTDLLEYSNGFYVICHYYYISYVIVCLLRYLMKNTHLRRYIWVVKTEYHIFATSLENSFQLESYKRLYQRNVLRIDDSSSGYRQSQLRVDPTEGSHPIHRLDNSMAKRMITIHRHHINQSDQHVIVDQNTTSAERLIPSSGLLKANDGWDAYLFLNFAARN